MKQMEMKPLGRLSSCSKDCLEEVRNSGLSITKLEFNWIPHFAHLAVNYNQYRISMVFCSPKNDEKKECKVVYEIPNVEKKTWLEAGNVGEIAIKYFESFLKYASNIEELIFVTLFSIQNNLTFAPFIFPFEQASNLRAKKIWLSFGDQEITSENLNQYLKLWKNGRIDRNVESVEFENLKNLNYDLVMNGLDVIDLIDRFGWKIFNLKNVNGTTFNVIIMNDRITMKLIISNIVC
ncbi:unnamed protein product [Caenorhabditis angaria]|uniref:F-box associated domain-containing protein n=1 Tax=Caenorhabditis angaria TaxID=860376 RepID=A0A9P1I6F0_9PELO|nr:unnamed protein product [Caenorhabditis angaria]